MFLIVVTVAAIVALLTAFMARGGLRDLIGLVAVAGSVVAWVLVLGFLSSQRQGWDVFNEDFYRFILRASLIGFVSALVGIVGSFRCRDKLRKVLGIGAGFALACLHALPILSPR